MTARHPASLILFTGTFTAGCYGYLCWLSRGYANVALADAALVYGVAWLLYAGLIVWLVRSGQQAVGATVVLLAVGFALLFRVLGVLTFPVLEDDFYRYLWDGRLFIEQGSPFAVPPSAFFGTELPERFADILDAINYPDIATVYGPSLQLLFGASYLLMPGSVLPLQLVAGLADIGVLLILLRVMQPATRRALGLWLLYAWSPLLLKEFAVTAHPDILGALLLLLGILLRKPAAERQVLWLLIGALMALAVGVKPFALVIVPFVIGRRLSGWAGFAAGLILLTLPFAGQLPWPAVLQQVWLPAGLQAMGNNWVFNALLHNGAYWLGGVDANTSTRWLLVGFAAVWLLQWLRFLLHEMRGAHEASDSQEFLRQSPIAWLAGLFLLVLPALNPWYLAWWLPFVMGRNWLTPWVASAAVMLSYLSGINLAVSSGSAGYIGGYSLPGWVLVVEGLLIVAALAFDLARSCKAPQQGDALSNVKRPGSV